MNAVQDSRKIEVLGPMVEELARVFEDTMTMSGLETISPVKDFIT